MDMGGVLTDAGRGLRFNLRGQGGRERQTMGVFRAYGVQGDAGVKVIGAGDDCKGVFRRTSPLCRTRPEWFQEMP